MKLNPLPPPFEYVEKKSKKKTKIIIALSIIVLLTVLFLYIFAYKNTDSKDQDKEESIVKTAEDLPKLKEDESGESNDVKIITEEITENDKKEDENNTNNTEIEQEENNSKSDSNSSDGNTKENSDKTNVFIFDSDKKLLSQEDLENKSHDELRMIKNEIYARHGYIFVDKKMKEYFESQEWYSKNEQFSPSTFNDYERENLKIITKHLSEQ